MAEAQRDVVKPGKVGAFPGLRKGAAVCAAILCRCVRPGCLALFAVSLPHVIMPVVDSVWRQYSHLLRSNETAYLVVVHILQVVAVLGVTGWLVAMRVALRPRKARESRWGLDRVLAVIALLVFAASIKSTSARYAYYSFSQEMSRRTWSEEAIALNKLYKVHEGMEGFAGEYPERYFPALRRMDTRFPETLYLPLPWRDLQITTHGLPLRICWQGRFFYYPGYRLRNDADVHTFAQAYREVLADPEHREYLLLDPTYHARLGTYRIPSTVPGLVLPDRAWSGIPVLIEQIDPETATHGDVLFANGHTERIPYPGRWPMTEATIKTLQALAAESLQQARGE